MRRTRAYAVLLGGTILGCGGLFGLDDEASEPAPDNVDANVDGADAAEETKVVSVIDGGTDTNAPVCDASDCEHAVFVTSTKHAGSQLQLFDARCQQVADDSARPRIRFHKFKAWISTSTETAAERHEHSALPYFKVTESGEHIKVASNWTGLVSGALLSPIDLTEEGKPVSGTTVWTGTKPGGDRATLNCGDWKSGGGGRVGNASLSDTRWTDDRNETDCAQEFHIYCIEVTQP